MRALWALLACAALAPGGDREADGVDGAAVRALVDDLGSARADLRSAAYARLAEMGKEVDPVLQALESPVPEVRRRIASLLRRWRPVSFSAWLPEHDYRVGGDLMVLVTLRNESPWSLRAAVGGDAFRIRLARAEGDATMHAVPRTCVESTLAGEPAAQGFFFELAAAEAAVFRIRMEGHDSPLRRPGEHRLTVHLGGDGLRFAGRATGLPSALVSPELRVEVRGRTVEQLRDALKSDIGERAGAVAELLMREDAEALPLLREHARNPALRDAAIRRLAAVAHPDDLDLFLEAAKNRHDRPEVRTVAVLALSRYRDDRARVALLGLALDERLRETAVDALAHHKHPQTVSCYLSLLKRTYRGGAWVERIQDVLYDWTGRVVRADRRSEVDALERWWRENRVAWTERNCPDAAQR